MGGPGKYLGNSNLKQVPETDPPHVDKRRHMAVTFFLDSASIFRNKQTSAKTQRAPMGPNVRGVSTGGICKVWAKFDSGEVG